MVNLDKPVRVKGSWEAARVLCERFSDGDHVPVGYITDSGDFCCDAMWQNRLENVPQKHSGWVIVYTNESAPGRLIGGLYDKKGMAEAVFNELKESGEPVLYIAHIEYEE